MILTKSVLKVTGLNMAMFSLLQVSPLTLSADKAFAQQDLSAEEGKAYGGTLTIGFDYEPTLINPILTSHSISSGITPLVFSRLIRSTSKGELEPDLAYDWDISSDGLEYTFHLRKGVRFHDGTEFTSEDVLYTFRAIKDPATQSPYHAAMQFVEKFDAPNRYTFKVLLTAPHVPFIYGLVREIVPQHLYEGSNLRSTHLNYSPIGTGPFRFKEWREDNQITLEANPDYFEGRPYLDKVVYKTYPNRTEIWSALMRQEIDLMVFMNAEDYELTRKDPAFDTYTHPGPHYYALAYNLEDPILSDVRVRKAIAHAVNRREVIRRVEKGYGVECSGPFSPDSWGFNPDVEPFAYDPVKALRILNEAGWEDADGDGVLEKDGDELIIRALADSRKVKAARLALLLRQQLQEVGIKFEIYPRESANELTGAYLSRKKIQAEIRLFSGGGSDPDIVKIDWHSSALRKHRLWPYTDARVDALIKAGQINRDRAKRQSAYHEIHRLIYEDQPACFLYFPYWFHAASKRVAGTEELLNVHMPDYVIKNIYIKAKNAH